MHYRVLFEPLLPLGWLLLWLALCVMAAVWGWRRQRGRLLPRRRHQLLAAECAAAALFALYASRPAIETISEDTGAYRVIILVDESESMQQCDTADGASRGQHATQVAERLSAELAAPCELRRFGDSAIGAALARTLVEATRPGKLPPGAIVLLSDGHAIGEAENAAIDAARQARHAQLPISTLCSGTPENPPRVEIIPEKQSINLADGATGQAAIVVRNGFDTAQSLTVELRDGGKLLCSENITIAARAERPLKLAIPAAEAPGERILSITATGTQPQYLRVNDLAPEEKQLLYLGSASSWQWRFLRQCAEKLPAIQLDGIIHLPIDDKEYAALPADFRPQRRFWSSLPDCDDWPQAPSALSDYAAIIIACEVTQSFPQATREALIPYVNAGGSILFIGDASALPEALKPLCPGREFASARATGRERAYADSTMLFNDAALYTMLTQTPLLPRGAQFVRCTAPGVIARTLLALPDGAALLLARGAGGSGRTAWLGITESWQWKLTIDASQNSQRYDAFWKCLLEWLSSERIRLLEATLPTKAVLSDTPVPIVARVLNDDFTPANNAQVRAALTAPDGATQFVTLYASAAAEGDYTAEIKLSPPGVWKAKLEATSTPGAPTRRVSGHIIVTRDERENTQTAADPALMADIARITGGTVLTENTPAEQITIAPNVPKIKNKKFPLEHTLTCIVLALLLTIIWRMR